MVRILSNYQNECISGHMTNPPSNGFCQISLTAPYFVTLTDYVISTWNRHIDLIEMIKMGSFIEFMFPGANYYLSWNNPEIPWKGILSYDGISISLRNAPKSMGLIFVHFLSQNIVMYFFSKCPIFFKDHGKT